jgi:hypothetical protein
MAVTSNRASLDALEPLVGEWSLLAVFEDVPPADIGAPVTFEWLPGKAFLIERWEIPVPEAPDGIAIVGPDPQNEGRPDLSPLDFTQRFAGTFSGDGKTITGAWEICHDGTRWEHDFDLTYVKT